MSFEKVVIQQNQEDGSYLELYPKTDSFTKKEILLSTTSTSYDLPESAVPDDIFQNIRVRLNLIGSGQAYLALTLVDTNGNKMSGVKVTGFVKDEIYSDDNGIAKGYIVVGGATLKVSGYADITDNSILITAKSGEFVTNSLTLTTTNFLQITSSRSYMFSPNVQFIDVSIVGGGGGRGGGAGEDQGYSRSGGGGGAGDVQELVNFVPDSTIAYTVVVGAGGSGGEFSDNRYMSSFSAKSGGNGGDSSAFNVTATGGSGGGGASSNGSGYGGSVGVGGSSQNGAGASGVSHRYSGFSNGIAGSAGTKNTYKSFSEDQLSGGGGRSGVAGYGQGIGGKGGSPAGGNGGTAGYGSSDGSNGVNTLGGGRGGRGSYANWNSDDKSWDDNSTNGGKGGSGMVAIRMHLKNT